MLQHQIKAAHESAHQEEKQRQDQGEVEHRSHFNTHSPTVIDRDGRETKQVLLLHSSVVIVLLFSPHYLTFSLSAAIVLFKPAACLSPVFVNYVLRRSVFYLDTEQLCHTAPSQLPLGNSTLRIFFGIIRKVTIFYRLDFICPVFTLQIIFFFRKLYLRGYGDCSSA